SWAAFTALLVHAQRSRTKSLRAWALIAFPAVCNVILLATARANVGGPDIAREYRYQTETAALFVIAVGLAYLPLLGAPEQNEVHPDAPQHGPRLSAFIPAVVVAAATVSSVRYVDLWQDRNPSEQYFANVRTSLAHAPDRPVPLADLGIPQTLLWAYRFPENTYSPVFRHLDDKTTSPRSSVDRLYVFDDQGHLSPATI